MSYSQVGRGARVANLQTQQRQKYEADLAAQRLRDRENKVDDRVWVCCNKCDKWRALPANTNTRDLPDIWICDYNTTDPARSTCNDPEEVYVQPDAELKSFMKVWLKRLRNVERAEKWQNPSAVTRGRKRMGDVEWIKCSKPSCGKWRAISMRGLETTQMVKKLKRGGGKGSWNATPVEWFCGMNTWDETKASCNAPQEPLWDCRWSLGN